MSGPPTSFLWQAGAGIPIRLCSSPSPPGSKLSVLPGLASSARTTGFLRSNTQESQEKGQLQPSQVFCLGTCCWWL